MEKNTWQGKMLVGFLGVVLIVVAKKTVDVALHAKEEKDHRSRIVTTDASLCYPYQGLDAEGKALYDTLYTSLTNFETDVDLRRSYTDEAYEKIYLMLRMQEPQFFYVSDDYELAREMDRTTIHYDVETGKAEQMLEEAEKAADDIISKIRVNADDYEKCLKIHDEIAKRCTYSAGEHSNDMYGCLVNGMAECEGYAKAFCYVARRAGVNVMCVTGYSNQGEAHAWNIAEINGKYYNIDLTWDDNASFQGKISHAYFAMSDSQFGDHESDCEGYIAPECATAGALYHQKNGYVLRERAQLEPMLRDWGRGRDGMLEFYCSNKELYDQVLEALQKDSGVKELLSKNATDGNFQYVQDENRQIITILF